MSKQANSNVCRRFNELPWHDSKLLGFKIDFEGDTPDNLQLEVKLNAPDRAKRQWRNSKLIFKECRFIKLDLDLLGIQLCGGDIASATCETNSALKKKIEDFLEVEFDLPEERNPFETTFHYQVLMIHPGGELNLFAKEFELEYVD